MAMRVFLLAASAAVLVSAQGSDRSAGCTAKSFAIPSWLVQDVEDADGVVSFNLQNRATNYTASLSCETTEAGLNACSVQGTPSSDDTLEAAVEASSEPMAFHLKQSWTCDDRGEVLTFTAVGNNSAPTADYTSPLLIKASLTSPVAITPVYADGPSGHDSPGCAARSETPSWELSSIHYVNEPGDGESSRTFVNFNLVVTNPANGYQASCMPAGSFGETPDLSRLMCAGYEFQSFSIGQYPITTQASFDPDTSNFSLTQTWFCDDADPAKPVQITATGATTLPLTCTTSPSTTSPNLTNTYCTTFPSTLPLPGTLDSTTPLAPYVLEEPIPSRRGDGCTLTSILNPRWEFSAFSLTDGRVGFEVILAAEDRGFQYPMPIYQGEALEGVEGEEGWYECVVGADGGNGLPLWPYACSLRYEAGEGGEGGELVMRAEWECIDLDAVHPVNFSGVTTTTVNSTITCETVNGESRCATAEPWHSWVAPISNVTWGESA